MNNKGQIGIGALIAVAIGVIVCLVLLQPIAVNVAQTSLSTDIKNVTYTAGAAGACVDLVGQSLASATYTVLNASGTLNSSDKTIMQSNFTITPKVSSTDNLLRLQLCTTNPSVWASKSVNVTMTYHPEGYAEDAGARSITSIILLLAAVAIALIVLPTIRDKFD